MIIRRLLRMAASDWFGTKSMAGSQYHRHRLVARKSERIKPKFHYDDIATKWATMSRTLSQPSRHLCSQLS